MVLYFSIALVLFLLALLRLLGAMDRRYEGYLALVLVVATWLFSWLRWETGTDWDSYITMYGDMITVEAVRGQTWWGAGYGYIALLVNLLGGGYTAFLCCISTIIFVLTGYLLLRTTNAPLVAVFVLFCVSFLNLLFVRESVSVMLFWLFCWLYFQKQYLPALLIAVLAFAFHSGSILPLGIVVITDRLSWKRLALVVVLVAVAVYLFIQFLDFDQLVKLLPLLSYFTSGFVEEKASLISTTARAYIKLSFWLVVILLNWRLLTAREVPGTFAMPEWTRFCLKAAMAIMVAVAVLLPFTVVFSRIPSYMMPLFAVVLANRKFKIRSISATDVAYLACCLLLFVQLGFLYSSYAELFYPFKTVLLP